ncbi:MAG: NAD(P)-dependent dehydrogenase (short-subunit alcohol dehydrogenase family) [Paraglaciecola sp.]|jgi:NAD(P)-dependent dehydrogenase (short-subunit alcohol dehydrogenase family)|uniref:SDR family NAD(P)-dependent oxidoreductase n=1 Tax=uncultured Paraglaciecola sp. TaxID=1765024 RepID=UPI0025CCEDB7|nr:SDR family NAD(P)-dependent oxidoreductase [uncultured Paraglaciecola sp.]
MFKGNALVIGASGGIGKTLVKQLHESGKYEHVYAVSRNLPASPLEGVQYYSLDSESEDLVAEYCQQLKQIGGQFSLVVCCIGALHSTGDDNQKFMPEKRLEDIQKEQLSFYLTTNAILPAIWLKNVEKLLKGPEPSKLVFFSARVGSISDNSLGGWYGYRASKSALNMLIKCAQIECQRRAKNITLISYHPGTVETELSKPFQSKVPSGKLFSTDFTVTQLLQIIPNLTPEDGPHYIDWQGNVIPW